MTIPKFKNFNIEAYKSGKSKIKKLKKIIKLSANESALGMSPRAKKIISDKKLKLERNPEQLLYQQKLKVTQKRYQQLRKTTINLLQLSKSIESIIKFIFTFNRFSRLD